MRGKDFSLPMASMSLAGAVRATFMAAEKLSEAMEANMLAEQCRREVLQGSGDSRDVGGKLKRLDGNWSYF